MSEWPNLFKYVITGAFDKDVIDRYLQDIRKQTSCDSSILHFAVIGGNLKTIKYLIDNGADVNAVNDFGETPLHWCCKEGNLEITRLLISCGADYTLLDNDENSVLHWVAEYDEKEMLLEFLKKNIQIQGNIYNQTPLDVALLNNSYKSIEILKCIERVSLPSSKYFQNKKSKKISLVHHPSC